jgi:hypothetical protein
MVSPPPGVSSGRRVPPIASVRPRATASPNPTPAGSPVPLSRSNGRNARSLSYSGMPGPWSMTRNSNRSPRDGP